MSSNSEVVMLEAFVELAWSTEGKIITFHGLAYPKLTWGSSNFVCDH